MMGRTTSKVKKHWEISMIHDETEKERKIPVYGTVKSVNVPRGDLRVAVTANVPYEIKERLVEISVKSGYTLSKIVNDAIQNYLSERNVHYLGGKDE